MIYEEKKSYNKTCIIFAVLLLAVLLLFTECVCVCVCALSHIKFKTIFISLFKLSME